MNAFMESCQWLENVPRYGHKDGLNNMLRLMDRLGHPEKSLKVIHVAGTNGKGSCCAMLHQILKECGFSVGLYTSPHLVDYRERIRVSRSLSERPGEDYISEEDFVRLLDEIRRANDLLVEEGWPHATFFEFLTAMALVYFAEQKVDYCVLETGVGGRLDATNIIEKPLLTMITSISLDHTKTLGDTIAQIAGEKAGIIKAGVPVVISRNPEEAVDVILSRAREMEAPAILAPEAPEVPVEDQALSGSYQRENTAAVLTAVGVLRSQGVEIPEKAVSQGLAHVYWPGRMQRLKLSENSTILLDGAHNPDAALRLGTYIAGLEEPVDVVFGALNKKDVTGVLKGLLQGSRRIRRLLHVPIEGSDCLQLADLKTMTEELGAAVPVVGFPSVEACLKQIEAPLTIVAGSLYLVGEVLKVMERM